MKLNFYLDKHLGDCVFHLHYCRALIRKHPTLDIEFYVLPQYLKELHAHVIGYEKNIKLGSIQDKGNAQDAWIGRDGFYMNYWKSSGHNYYDKMYVDFYNYLSRICGVESPFKDSEDILSDYEEILKPNSLSGKYDFLLINSAPLSGQLAFDKKRFDKAIKPLVDKGYKMVATNHSSYDIPCTLDHGLNLVQIGNLSLSADHIIGINTGPHVLTFNKFSIGNFKKYYHLHNAHHYSYRDNIIHCRSINELADTLQADFK